MLKYINTLFVGMGWCILMYVIVAYITGGLKVTHIDDGKNDIIIRFK